MHFCLVCFLVIGLYIDLSQMQLIGVFNTVLWTDCYVDFFRNKQMIEMISDVCHNTVVFTL